MNLELEKKVAIVTGAGNGIGAGIATRLAAEGASVVLADIDGRSAERQATLLSSAGFSAMAVAADVSSMASVDEMVAKVMDKHGRIDILVNNAGFTKDNRIGNMSEGDWDDVVDVILKGSFLCSRAVVVHMAQQGWGRIVNISSRAYLGNRGQVNYSAAKAGLLGFTRSLSLEEGRNGITVNAIAPGMIDTEALRALPHFENFIEAAIKNTPVRRVGLVEDISSAVAFLVSGCAGYITGEVLHVTGGRY
ncbi:3-oxoacyl-ACP reductase FabG [Alcaligenaceae bacterium]|nr:3-oxoacyl-ACP reductase FabG [Alcaligenaceae bacterium]